ncbi:MAG: outer membrane beta-barrel protein [Pleurocapsa sp.]
MNIKTSVLAIILATGFPLAVQAQEVNDYANYQVACDSGAECNDFEVNYEQSDGDEVAQTRRTRPGRTRTGIDDDQRIYAGATLGIFFPSEIDNFQVGVVGPGNVTTLQTVDPGNGFGGSVYGGYQFSELIGADIEAFVFGGDAEPFDSSYTSYGFFVNPRFTYTLDPDNDRSIYVFASPGIGLAGINFKDDLSDALGGDSDSGTGFALQIKAGGGYPVSDSIDIIAQARYFNAFNAIETTQFGQGGTISQTEDKDFNAFSIEAGANFKF